MQCSFIFTHRRTHTSYMFSDTCIVTAASPQPPFCTHVYAMLIHFHTPTHSHIVHVRRHRYTHAFARADNHKDASQQAGAHTWLLLFLQRRDLLASQLYGGTVRALSLSLSTSCASQQEIVTQSGGVVCWRETRCDCRQCGLGYGQKLTQQTRDIRRRL